MSNTRFGIDEAGPTAWGMSSIHAKGSSSIVFLQGQKAKECYDKYSSSIDSFVNCFIGFHKKFNEESAIIEKKINWTNLELSRCLQEQKETANKRTSAYKKSTKEMVAVAKEMDRLEREECYKHARANVERAYSESKSYLFNEN